MKVTALEIRQQQFPLRFRGLDPGEVDKFLELVAGDMEDLVRENARLRDALARKDQELERMQQGEDELKKALMAIQQIREDWIGRAEKQAEQVVLESTLKANQLQVDAERRLEVLQQDVQELKTPEAPAHLRHASHRGRAPPGARNDRGSRTRTSADRLPPLLDTSEPRRT